MGRSYRCLFTHLVTCVADQMPRKTWKSLAINALSWKTDQSAVPASSADNHEAFKALTLPIICPFSPAPQLQTSLSLRSGGDSLLLRPQRRKEIKDLSIDCVLACGCCRLCRVHRHKRPFLHHERDPSAPADFFFSHKPQTVCCHQPMAMVGLAKLLLRPEARCRLGDRTPLSVSNPGLWLQNAYVRCTGHHSPSLWPLS